MSNNETKNRETQDLERDTGRSCANPEEIAWLAGLLEGEGGFNLDMYKGGNGFACKLLVQVRMCAKKTVEHARDIIQKITHRRYTIHEHHPKGVRYPVFTLRVMDQKGCRKVCETILPYLITKKEQAEIIIEFCLVRKARKHNKEWPQRGGNPRYDRKEYELIDTMKEARIRSYTPPLEGAQTERLAPEAAI